MTDEEEWQLLIKNCKNRGTERKLSSFITVGHVVCSFMTKNKNVYDGISYNTACSLGMCAEKNAVSNMILNADYEIEKAVIMKNGKLIIPCGACREIIYQLSPNNRDTKFLINAKSYDVCTLNKLLPLHWKMFD